MQVAIRAADTIDKFDGINWIPVPDVKFGGDDDWTASAIPGQTAFFIRFTHGPENKQQTILMHGPHTVGTPGGDQTYYFCDIKPRVLQRLKNQLGDANATKLKVALRNRRPLRIYCRESGFSMVRNAANAIVGCRMPLVIAGRASFDLDGDDIETADTLQDME